MHIELGDLLIEVDQQLVLAPGGVQPLAGTIHQIGQIDPLPLQLEVRGADAGHVQQVLHIAVQAARLLLHRVEQLVAILGTDPVTVFQQCAAGPHDGGERCLQIVGDRGEQGGTHPIRLRLQLAVGQPLVEIDPRQGGADVGEQRLQLMFGGGGERAGQPYPQHQFIGEVVVLGLGRIEGGGVGPGALLLGQAPVDGSLVGLARCPHLVSGSVLILLIQGKHGLPQGQGDGLGTLPEHLHRAAGGGQPLAQGQQGVAELLGLAQAHQLLALAGCEPPRRHADDEQHEQGEQVAVAGHAQGEVGGGEQQIVRDEPQHGGQDGGHQAGGEGSGEYPQHEQQRQGGGRQPVGEPPGAG
ncbi:hypothetical protein D3C85_858670 [compost metagenome]